MLSLVHWCLDEGEEEEAEAEVEVAEDGEDEEKREAELNPAYELLAYHRLMTEPRLASAQPTWGPVRYYKGFKSANFGGGWHNDK